MLLPGIGDTQAETEVTPKANQACFEDAFENAPLGMALTGLDRRLLRANRAFRSLVGYSEDELRARDILTLTHPSDRAVTLEARQLPLTEPRVAARLETRYVHKDGRAFWVQVDFSLACNAQGGPLHFVFLIQEITERKRAEEVLKESEVRFRELFEHSPAAVWEEDLSQISVRFSELRAQGITDLRTHLTAHPNELVELASRVRIQEVNKASLRLFGASSEEELVRELPRFLNDASLGVFREEMAVLFEGNTKYEAETPRCDVHGNVLDLQLRLSVLPGHVSNLSRVLVSFTDLTSRKTAEAERQELERRLNHLQRLESLGRLASGVSHDMNNVLQAIMAIGSMLKARHKQDPSLGKDAEALIQAAIRGRDLVKGLRDFSRKELQSAAKLDLNELARREADLLERTTLKRVSIQLNLAPNLPSIFGESSSIQNAVMNLCVNAIDAMPNKGTLTLITRDIGQGFVELAVEDDGEGMSPDVLARAPEPFFTTKPIGKGTGLGLSQVYGTVKSHGGTLDIDSKPGHGTRVAMAFPSIQTLLQKASGKAVNVKTPARVLEILLVDDEELVRGTVVSMLDVLGHHAQSASSGLEALRRLEAGMEVHLVILDINMPGMDGVETLSRLRSIRPELPVLFATGFVDERLPAILTRFPSVRIIKKPFGLTELRQALVECV